MLKNQLINNSPGVNFINPDECPKCGMATRHMAYLDCMNHISNCETELLRPTEMPVEISHKETKSPFGGNDGSWSEPGLFIDGDCFL